MKKILYGLVILIVLVLLGWLAFGYFGVQALFTNTVVDEEIPSTGSGHLEQAPTDIRVETLEKMKGGSGDIMNAPDQSGHLGAFPFQQGEEDAISGEALFTSNSDGKTLSLKDFNVTNGPDLYVYLVKTSTDHPTSQDVNDAVQSGHYISLSPLKGNVGNQSYILPASIQDSEYNVVSIWCQRFGVNFGFASL